MKIAVTTASGQLGSAFIGALLKVTAKENIIGIARTPENVRLPGIEIRKGDYNSKEDFLQALNGIEVLLMVSNMDVPEKRVGQHRNILEAASEKGVRKIVYTSIVGEKGDSSFDPVVQSNRQTEKDIMESGLQWAIGRNGLYIEPDVEYMETYRKDGKVANCAGEGRCSYTTRDELAHAYTQLVLHDDRNGRIYNLAGEAISQQQLCGFLNRTFGTQLYHEDMSPEAYLSFQLEHNGEYLGPILAGIYTKIRKGEFNVSSDFEAAAGRKHIDWESYFSSIH